jgi:hypothetical protein
MEDKAKEMAEKAAQSGKGDEAIDKAADKADQATGGKHTEKIDDAADKAREAMHKHANQE